MDLPWSFLETTSWDDKVLCWSSSNLRLILILKFVFEAWPCNCCLLLAWELHLPCIQKERKRHVYFLALLLSLKRHEALCNYLAFFSNSWHPQLVSSMTPFYSIERIDDSKWNQYTTEAIGCYRMIQSLCTMYPCKQNTDIVTEPRVALIRILNTIRKQ